MPVEDVVTVRYAALDHTATIKREPCYSSNHAEEKDCVDCIWRSNSAKSREQNSGNPKSSEVTQPSTTTSAANSKKISVDKLPPLDFSFHPLNSPMSRHSSSSTSTAPDELEMRIQEALDARMDYIVAKVSERISDQIVEKLRPLLQMSSPKNSRCEIL